MDRKRELQESQEEVEGLRHQTLSEVTPSRRDFAQYVATQKRGLAVVARLSSSLGAGTELPAHAEACDAAEVAALAVATEAGGLTPGDMKAIAAATTAPILRDALLLDRSQIFAARLHGADAVLLPAHELAAEAIAELVAVARSLHMAAVIEVTTATDLPKALTIPHVVLALDCTTAAGNLDLDATVQLASAVPPTRTTLVRPEVRDLYEAERLVGACDAIVVEHLLAGVTNIEAAIAPFLAL